MTRVRRMRIVDKSADYETKSKIKKEVITGTISAKPMRRLLTPKL